MKINNIQITSASALNIEFATNAPICVLHGSYSDLALDLMRELIGDYNCLSSPDRVDDGRFVIHAEIETGGKNYAACYIRNADFIGDNRLAVNFKPNSIDFSMDDTLEFMEIRKEHNVDTSNVFDRLNYASGYETASEQDKIISAFQAFIEYLKDRTADGDTCPVFIYDCFERLDEAVDIAPILDKLSSLGRQVFISVCSNYPTEKAKHNKVQVIKMEADNAKD